MENEGLSVGFVCRKSRLARYNKIGSRSTHRFFSRSTDHSVQSVLISLKDTVEVAIKTALVFMNMRLALLEKAGIGTIKGATF